MSVIITIGTTIIEFPSAGDAPSWAESITEFAQAVETQLQTISNQYDIVSQIYNITPYTDSTYRDVPNLSFPVANIRGAIIEYTVYRTSDTTANRKYEKGIMEVLYDTTAGSWILTRDFQGNGVATATAPTTNSSSNSVIDFQITNGGQIQFRTPVSVAGANYSAKLSFSAKTLQHT